MERFLRGVAYAQFGLIAGLVVVGPVRPPASIGYGTLLVSALAGLVIGIRRPTKGQHEASPRWARGVRVAIALLAVAVQAFLVRAATVDIGGFEFVPATGFVVAVLLLAAVGGSNSRRNAITLLPAAWTIEIFMLAGLIVPGFFVAAATIAVTVCALIPDGSQRLRARPAAPPAPERRVLLAATSLAVLGVTSLMFGAEASTSTPASTEVRPVAMGPIRSQGFLLDRSCSGSEVTATCTAITSALYDLVIPFFVEDINDVPLRPNADLTVYSATVHGVYPGSVDSAAATMDAALDRWRMTEGNLQTGHFVAIRDGDGYPARTVRVDMEARADETGVHVTVSAPTQR